MTHNPAVEAVIDRVAALLDQRTGLRPEPTLRGRLRRCIRTEATARGQSPQAYLATLDAQPEALQSLLNRVTVQETGFFRHPDHFDVLAHDVLPKLSEPVTIWSAGCANGQEAYTLAMVLEEQGIDGTIIATDLSTAALQRTAAAQYATRELSGLSPARRQRHLVSAGRSFRVSDAVRKRVTVLRHNLIDPLPERVRTCQVVFCRNVLIYITQERTTAFLDRVADALPADGYLFLGSAETIWAISERFDTVRIADSYLYRRRAAGHPQVPAAGPLVARASATRLRPEDHDRAARRLARRPGGEVVRHATADSAQLARAGQLALDEGNCRAAVVAFRKWAYVAPDDAMAHLHLGLALEASGDQPSAQRAFAAARLAVQSDQTHVEQALEGYAADELLRLLDAKQRVVHP